LDDKTHVKVQIDLDILKVIQYEGRTYALFYSQIIITFTT